MKLAFADTYRYVADPRAMEVTPAEMLDDGYLAERAKLIDMNKRPSPGLWDAAIGRDDLPDRRR